MTADPGIGEDAALFFRNMGIGNLEGRYDHLLSGTAGAAGESHCGNRAGDAERPGGYLFFKLNSLTDRRIIETAGMLPAPA